MKTQLEHFIRMRFADIQTIAFKLSLCDFLSGHVPEIQAEVEVVKIKNPDFSSWS
jgi:hypothetical protein